MPDLSKIESLRAVLSRPPVLHTTPGDVPVTPLLTSEAEALLDTCDSLLSELTALRERQERLVEALRVARPWVLKAGDREVAARADVRADLALIDAALAGEADDDQEES